MSSLLSPRNQAACAIAIAMGLLTTSAHAEWKNTSSWNATSVAAACNKNGNCMGGTTPSGGYKAEVYNGNTITQIRCTSNSCSYQTTPTGGPGGGGSPARVAQFDKTLGTGVGLGGILAGGATAPKIPKADVGQRIPVTKIDAPKIQTPKVDVPRVSADIPKAAGAAPKDIKVR